LEGSQREAIGARRIVISSGPEIGHTRKCDEMGEGGREVTRVTSGSCRLIQRINSGCGEGRNKLWREIKECSGLLPAGIAYTSTLKMVTVRSSE
jgi:hypothetical protein